VIDGTTARLSTVAALDLVNKAGRNRDTILVLTKADNVASENVKTYIIDRILGTSSQLSFLLQTANLSLSPWTCCNWFPSKDMVSIKHLLVVWQESWEISLANAR
jgi:hypothetical protein